METQSKTHWKKAFKSDYLASSDVPSGQDLVLTIAKVELKEAKLRGNEVKLCNIATFKEKGYKPMILNVTNSKQVKTFTKSRFIDDWKNVPISLYVDTNVRMGRDITEGLRIRSQQPDTLTTKEAAKKELQGQVRIALSKYKGSDKEQIKESLNDGVRLKTDSVEFYESILESLTQ